MNANTIRQLDELETMKKELEKRIAEIKADIISEIKEKGTYTEKQVETENGVKVVATYKKELANGKVVVTYVNNPRYGLNQKELASKYPEIKEACSGFSDNWSLKH